MKILLINPPCRIAWHVPVGLGYIASTIREQGHDVRILDINGLGHSQKKVEQLSQDFEFDLIGIGGLSSTYQYVKWLTGIIKKHKPNIPVVAGNMVSTAHPELLLKNSAVDIAVIDEGELTFAELILAIKESRDLKEIKGIAYKDNSQVIKTTPRERISELDSLPYPAWDLFPLENYWRNPTESPTRFNLRSIMVSAVRGCPYDCIFCSHPFGKRVYRRSAASVIDEIKELKKRYRVEFINFADDLFLVSENWVLDFCERMIAENLGLKWSVTGRVNLVNDRLLRKMHQAGCAEMGYGFESGSQDMLDRMKKKVTVRQAEQAIQMTRRAKIRITGSFIFGMPGETESTINQTLAFIKRTDLPIYRFFYATPYPGTELYRIAQQMQRLPEDEDRYVENLGEMRTTFLVNLTQFSDQELVRLKDWTEATAKSNQSLSLRITGFIENWQRRAITIRQQVKKAGLKATLIEVLTKILHRFNFKN